MSKDQAGKPAHSESPTSRSDHSSPVENKPVKKKRWLRRIMIAGVVMFVLLVGLIAAAPALLSTQTAARYAESMIGEQAGGKVSLAKLNLSWFDDCKVEDLTVSDAQGRNILNADSINVPGGVWGLLKRFDIPENVRIESPSVTLYMDQETDGAVEGPGKADASATPDAASKQGSTKLPAFKVIVRDGRVTIVDASSPDSTTTKSADYVVDEINADLSLSNVGQLLANVSGRSPEGATIHLDATVDDALGLTGSDFDLAESSGAVGSVRIHSDKPVNLQSLTAALPKAYHASGQVTLDVEAKIENGAIDSNLRVELIDITASGFDGADSIPPGRIGLTGTARVDKDTVVGQLDLEGDAGVANAGFTWPYREAESMPKVGDYVDAIMAGRVLELPQLAANLSGSVDLAVLSHAFPGLLRLQSGVALKGGTLDLHEFVVGGGNEPSAKLVASLHDVTAVTPTGSIQWDPATVELDVATGDERNLTVRRALVDAGVVKLEGSGDIEGLKATISGDLDRMHAKITPVLDLGIDELAGRFESKVDITRASPEQLGIACDLTGSQFRYRAGTNNLDIPSAVVGVRWDARLSDDHLVEINARETNVDLGGEIVVSAKGTYDAVSEGFSADVAAPQVQLNRLAGILGGFGVGAIGMERGFVSGVAHLERADARAAIITSGDLSARDMQVATETTPQRADLSWSGVRLDTLASKVFIESASLESAIAAVDVGKGELVYGDAFSLTGRFKGRADLRKVATFAAIEGEPSPMDTVAGHLVFDTNCESNSSGTSLRGQASVNDFAMQSDDGSVYQDQFVADYDVQVNTASDTLSVQKFALTSKATTVDISGKLNQYSTTQQANLDGKIALDWQRIMQLCHELYPATRDMLTIAGRDQCVVQLRGPLNLPDRTPPFRDATASAKLGWQSAELFGIPLGQLSLKPAFQNGNLNLPLTTIAAAGGSIQLGGAVEFASQGPVLRLPAQLKFLKGIEVTPQLGEQLLSHFNPIFGGATRMAGKLDLTVHELALPLGEAMYTGGSGFGRLDLHKFQVTPSQFLTSLLELGGMGQPDMYSIDVSGTDFIVVDGRISYDDLTLNFAQQRFDLKFRGSVGFDDTLDLFVSVPVQEHLLRKLKVQGPVGEYTTRLAGTRIEIPITGSRSNPKLDFSKVNVDSLLKDVLTDTLTNPGALLDALGNVAGGKQGGKDAKGGTDSRGKQRGSDGRGRARSKNGEKDKEDPGLDDLLGGVLGKGKDEGDKGKEGDKAGEGGKEGKKTDDPPSRRRPSKRKPSGRKRSSER